MRCVQGVRSSGRQLGSSTMPRQLSGTVTLAVMLLSVSRQDRAAVPWGVLAQVMPPPGRGRKAIVR